MFKAEKLDVYNCCLKQRPLRIPILSVNSGELVSIPILGRRNKAQNGKRCVPRDDFMNLPRGTLHCPSPIISASEFIPSQIIEHVMRNKKDCALGVKFRSGDQITPMEAVMHTFITPIFEVIITGDYSYQGKHHIEPYGDFMGKRVILSSAIQPDFEVNGVMSDLVCASEEAVHGQALDESFSILSAGSKADPKLRSKYDQLLKMHLIYYLTSTGKRLSVSEILKEPRNLIEEGDAMKYLKHLIESSSDDLLNTIENKYIRWSGYFISLEMMVKTYLEQMKNEFSVLENACAKPYIYTIDPPVIFANILSKTENGSLLLNRMQIIAIKLLSNQNSLRNAHSILFNDFNDTIAVRMLRVAFRGRNGKVNVESKESLERSDSEDRVFYNIPKNVSLLLHNNSDGFGQNIETEGLSSLDGVVGCFSNAYMALDRSRHDLTSTVW
eukprot:CAMPEP_0182441414 /NCGR_PEP_ID=MMETSP1172-20130603/371_1 /TAXON_ID=708627 /ORGANISM="Timspurckia oligopyrenoides, Strain CCMP3278" /LENGTH=440 /DNA_ID=CAMNT_0024635669 /DNA_START=182 /DNA_END=1501 /DNA_ORIENTATION=+